MATIRASCPTCGDVQLREADLTVRLCCESGSSSYVFRCPLCEIVVVKEAHPRVVELLVTSGVHQETWHLPAELFEDHQGEQITPDDILDFHLLLENDNWFAELASSLDGPIPL